VTIPPGHSVDAFHRGRFHLVQPEKGHRAGVDALILAACVPADFVGWIADLGAGSGAAGLAVLSRCAGARATLVERETEMVEAARMTLALPENSGIADRAQILAADVELSGRARVAAGLADNAFDFAVTNPPFNATDDRATPNALRKSAHVMTDGLLEAWIRTAAAILRPDGALAIIARPVSLPDVLASIERRFGGAEIVLVHPRPDAEAIRFVLRARRGSRAKLAFAPPLVLHGETGSALAPRADAIVNGETGMFGD
jgi:tRNA1(Val) A37 N6-methylase TrmN6